MRCNATCIRCLVDRQEEKIKKWSDETKKMQYMKEVTRLIGQSQEEDSAPYLSYCFNQLYEEYFEKPKDYREIKSEFNQLVLRMEDDLRSKIEEARDPLARAISYARIGNYIDFSAMEHVDKEQFLQMFEDKRDEFPSGSEKEYQIFLQECASVDNFLLIADNCGEIVLDKIFLQELQKRFPELHLTVMVKGKDVVNDATMEDAEEVKLSEAAKVIHNGAGIAGTEVRYISPQALEVLNTSDIILAKGQANFETLHGCGRNIYYSFLCKCKWFSEQFKVPQFTGMFLHERIN